MNLNLVIERECSRDHQTALRQFLCCKPGDPEWAMDPQDIYAVSACARPRPELCARFLPYPGTFPCMMKWSASANTVSARKPPRSTKVVHRHRAEGTGQHLGDTLLASVIMRLRDDAWRSNRTPLVLTQVDPRNKPSMDLFSRFGFVDEGPDPNDLEYHLLSLEFTGTNYVIGDQQGFPAAFHRNIPIAFVRDLFGLAVNT